MARRGNLRLARSALAVLALGCVLSLWSAWPAVLHLTDGSLPYAPGRWGALRAGPLRSAWQLWQMEQACAGGRSPLEAQGVTVAGGDLLQGELPLLTALALAPVTRSLGPAPAVQVAALAVPALAFAAAFLLAHAAGARALAACGAGFAYAFSPASAHGALRGLEGQSGPLVPLILLCGLAWMGAGERSRLWRSLAAAGTGLLLGLELLAAAHVAVLAACALLAAALAAPRLALPAPGSSSRAGLARVDGLAAFAVALGVSLCVCAALCAPVGGAFELFAGSAAGAPGLADVLRPPALHPLVGRPKDFDLFPGLVLCGLALLSLRRAPSGRRWLGCAALLASAPWWGIAAPERAFGLVLLPVAVAAAPGLEGLLAGGHRRPAQALLLALAFELLTVEPPRTPAGTPEAVRRLAARAGDGAAQDEGGAVAVVGHLGGPHAALLWQTVHRRPILFGGAEAELETLRRFGWRAPDLLELLRGRPFADPEALALDLALEDVEHVLLPVADEPRLAPLVMLLDEVEGWERADTRDGLAWWYRSPSSSSTGER